MSLLQNEINECLIDFMKARDSDSAEIVRSVLVEAKNLSSKAGRCVISDADVLASIDIKVGLMESSIKANKKAKNKELVEKETLQLALVNDLKPVTLSEEEVNAAVSAIVEKAIVDATSIIEPELKEDKNRIIAKATNITFAVIHNKLRRKTNITLAQTIASKLIVSSIEK